MAYRNKTFVSFDGDNDMHYYRLMCAWKARDGVNFNFYDAHDINSARDTSQPESIKRQLRERLINAKVFLILVGDRTRFLTKFVKWEAEQALSLDLPIVCVNLNGLRKQDAERCPPVLRDALAIHIPFKQSIVRHAIDHWPDSHKEHRKRGEAGPFFYKRSVYTELGL